ncbi:hypothetical protein NMY22_g3774 [Coprinellus aureogranulatus]|nr:hypothetical protein NMY22_g3774 [Coprinellus aureogranulatus]
MSDTQAPLSIESFEGEKTGRYIVLLKEDSVQSDVFSGIASINSFDSNTAVTHQWDAVNGFAGELASRVESLD